MFRTLGDINSSRDSKLSPSRFIDRFTSVVFLAQSKEKRSIFFESMDEEIVEFAYSGTIISKSGCLFYSSPAGMDQQPKWIKTEFESKETIDDKINIIKQNFDSHYDADCTLDQMNALIGALTDENAKEFWLNENVDAGLALIFNQHLRTKITYNMIDKPSRCVIQ